MGRLKELLSPKTASSDNMPSHSNSLQNEEQADQMTRDFARNLPNEIKNQPIGQAMILDEQKTQEKEREKQEIWNAFEEAGNAANQSAALALRLNKAGDDMQAACKELTSYMDKKQSIAGKRIKWFSHTSPDDSKMRRLKTGYEDVCKKLDSYSSLFHFIPSGDKYISLLTGTIQTIVEATVNHCEIGTGFEEGVEAIGKELDYCYRLLYEVRPNISAVDWDRLKGIMFEIFTRAFKFLTPYAHWCASKLERFTAAFDQNYYSQNVESPLKALLDAVHDISRENDLLNTKTLNKVNRSVDDIGGDVKEIKKYCEKLEKRAEQQEMIQKRFDRIETNLSAKIDTGFKELGMKANDLNRISAADMLRQKRLEKESTQLRALNRWQRVAWNTTKIEPPPSQSADGGTRAWVDVETASHFLEVVVENGYPIDEKDLKDIYISATAFAPLQEWMSAEEGGWLWLHGPPLTGTVGNVSVAAAYAVTLTEQLNIPTVAYRFRADDFGLAENAKSDAIGRSLAMDRFVLMIYSFVRQLIWLLPEEVETDIDLSVARFQRLDGGRASLLDAFNLIEALLTLMPKALVIVIDGVQYIDNDEEEAVDCTWGYLDLFLDILREAGQSRTLKVLLSSDGLCKTLSDEDVIGFQERAEIGNDEGSNRHLSEFQNLSDAEHSS